MLLRVIHETAYEYDPPVQHALHVAHLRPLGHGTQRLLEHALHIDPTPDQCTQDVDAHGNARAYFGLPFTHGTLRVRADSVVDTLARPAPAPGLPWEAVREHLAYRRGAPYVEAAQFCFASPYVPLDEDFAHYARACFTPGRPLMEAAAALMSRIHQDFAYAPQATDAGTPALEALRLRRGVCQDFTHVMTGCLRSLGLAARYASGYLLTRPPPGQPRLVGADASHAWVSVWSPGPDGGAWHDLDPTNDRAPGEDYVTLALGRDYADVAPLRGVIHGGGRHVLHVAVTVAPLQEMA